MGAHDSEEPEDGELPETYEAYGLSNGPYINFDALEPEQPSEKNQSKADNKRASKRKRALEALAKLQPHELQQQQQQLQHQLEQQHRHQQFAEQGKRQAPAAGAQRHQHANAGTSHGYAMHNAVYHNVQPSIQIKQAAGLVRLDAVRDLALYALLGASVVQPPSWAFLKNQPLIQRVALVMLPGLTMDTFQRHKGQMPHLAALGNPTVVTSTKDVTTPLDAARELLMVVDNSKGKRKRESQGQYSSHLDVKKPRPTPVGVSDAQAGPSSSTPQPEGIGDSHVGAGASSSGRLNGSAGVTAIAPFPSPPPSPPPPPPPPGSPPHCNKQQLSPSQLHKQQLSGQIEVPGPSSNPEQPRQAKDTSASGRIVEPQLSGGQQQTQQQQQPGQHVSDRAAGTHNTEGDTDWARQAPYPPSHYAATIKQLQDNNYPLPELDQASGGMLCPPGWVATQPRSDAAADMHNHDSTWAAQHIVALDCEMCMTAEGFELTRVTLVDAHGQVVADELVLPYNPITDYLERYSGINAAMLQDVATRLEDAQRLLLRHVHADTLLVGHALENDLRALKLLHGKILDTAILYPHPAGPPAKCALRVLSAKYLGRTIQQGSHDSAVDARTALDLVRLKVINGPGWGVEQGPPGAPNKKITDLLFERQCKSAVVGSLHALSRFASASSSVVGCTHDHEIAKKAAQLTRSHSFVVCQLTGLDSWLLARSQHHTDIDTGWILKPPEQQTGQIQPSSNASKQHNSDGHRYSSTSRQPNVQHSSKGSQPLNTASQSGVHIQEGRSSVPVDALLVGRHQTGQAVPGQPPLAKVLQDLDACVGSIWRALPSSTLLVAAAGSSDVHEWKRIMEQMFKRRRHMEEPLYVGWNQAADTAYLTFADLQRRTPAWAAVKQQ